MSVYVSRSVEATRKAFSQSTFFTQISTETYSLFRFLSLSLSPRTDSAGHVFESVIISTKLVIVFGVGKKCVHTTVISGKRERDFIFIKMLG